MGDDKLATTEPKKFQPASETVTERLERTGFTFNHEHFYQRLAEIKDLVLVDPGGPVFIPLLWGQPYVLEEENQISAKNILKLLYDPKHLFIFEQFTCRRPVKDVRGGVYIYTNTPESINMSDDDVVNRAQRVENFDLVVVPEYANIMHQQGGTTVITNESGLVRVSINCPYGVALGKDSPLKGEPYFPNIFDDSIETRIYLAAVLKKMGFEDELIIQATSLESREVSTNEFAVIPERIINALYEVPFVRKEYFRQGKWTKDVKLLHKPEDVYHAIMTTVQFNEDHNVSFKITKS